MLKHRNPKNTYVFADWGTNYIQMTRRTPLKDFGPVMYNKKNIPEWAQQCMRMLDLARDPETGKGEIPGYGRVRDHTYTLHPVLEDVPM